MSQHSQEVSISTSVVQEDLIRLLYRFDAKKSWQSFKEGAPHRRSVKKGKQTTSSKLKKIYATKKNRFQRCKNAAFNNINQLLLTCCESRDAYLEGDQHVIWKPLYEIKGTCFIRKPTTNRTMSFRSLWKVESRRVVNVKYHTPYRRLELFAKRRSESVTRSLLAKYEFYFKKLTLRALQ